MDVTQALKDTENALRDFISLILSKKIGKNWIEKCGASKERLKKWNERKEIEKKRQQSGIIEDRLIYYADFYDLQTILKKHWSLFSPALGEWKRIEIWLLELNKLRNPDAHRRTLLTHQKHLIVGIAGDIRSRLVRYRSKLETKEDYYPRIESASDNFGNLWTPNYGLPSVMTKTSLRPGDTIEFVISARDPLGEDLEYNISTEYIGSNKIWKSNNELDIKITEEDIGEGFEVKLAIRSNRKYHARGKYDHAIGFHYSVLPPKSFSVLTNPYRT